MSKFYAGIGSRKTPTEILRLMTIIASKLDALGWTLRSGGADGADSAFAQGTDNVELFLPWNNFNGLRSNFVGSTQKAIAIASNVHPAWHKCSQGARKLHSRNVHQVFGWDINPKTYSSFIICWTPNGESVGGTATAIKLAQDAGIRVLNLANLDDLNTVVASLDIK